MLWYNVLCWLTDGFPVVRNGKCLHEMWVYLMGPYNAGPKSALFLRVAEIRAGVKGLALGGPFNAGPKWRKRDF